MTLILRFFLSLIPGSAPEPQPARVGLASGQLGFCLACRGWNPEPCITLTAGEALFAFYFAAECFIAPGSLLIPCYNNNPSIFPKYVGQGWAGSQECAGQRTFQTLFPSSWSLSWFNEVWAARWAVQELSSGLVYS